MTWDELSYWQSGEWQVVEERLSDMDKSGKLYNPERQLLFAALDSVPLEKVKVCIIGQDPYPQGRYATGLAFSIPKAATSHPPTLSTVLREYEDDLHLPYPKNGNLEKWASQGVLLWNAIPSCEVGKSLSHDWVEWKALTQEIIQRLSDKGGIVFVCLGGVAREAAHKVIIGDDGKPRRVCIVDTLRNDFITTSHPSPRGNLNSKVPFSGSRIFSTINAYLCKRGKAPVDWKLENEIKRKQIRPFIPVRMAANMVSNTTDIPF
jgi:uracil-DNA glycosylase